MESELLVQLSIILSRLQNARAAFSGENIALKALDKWVAP
jgi:hypothetical protein